MDRREDIKTDTLFHKYCFCEFEHVEDLKTEVSEDIVDITYERSSEKY